MPQNRTRRCAGEKRPSQNTLLKSRRSKRAALQRVLFTLMSCLPLFVHACVWAINSLAPAHRTITAITLFAGGGLFLTKSEWLHQHADLGMIVIFTLGYLGIIFEELFEFNKAGIALLMSTALWITYADFAPPEDVYGVASEPVLQQLKGQVRRAERRKKNGEEHATSEARNMRQAQSALLNLPCLFALLNPTRAICR